ncbi:MAG TPA: sensor histidine kinase [Burkholderiales bacterium]|nr:sensor histidine kinase [Burkholderiales bacterium]
MRRWIVPLFALIATLGAACAAAAPPSVTTIERGEWVASDSSVPPPDSAPWRPVELPDDWSNSHPGFSGQLWYRFAFHTAAPKTTQVLYVPRNSAAEIEIFVNRELLSISKAYGDARITELQRPLIDTVPAIMLHGGNNVIHVRVTGSADYRHGLSRLTIGSGLIVGPQYYERRFDLQVGTIAMFGAALLVAGLLAFSVWGVERSDPVLLWFGLTALAWAASAYLLVWPPHTGDVHVRQLLLFAMQHLYVVPLIVLCLRVGGARYRRVEAVLWCAFAAACGAAAVLSYTQYPILAAATSVARLGLTIAALVWLVRVGIREHRWPLYSLGLALATVIVFSGYDWARWMGYADFDNLLLAPFAMPFLILALGATGVERHLSMTRAIDQSKRELEQRVAEKVREVEQTYRKMQEVLHEQTVLRERQRIMADMHDGLGSALIGLLSQVHGQSADLPQIEQRLSEMLTDLRAIVDSLQPVEGDLGVVLGNIRYRMSRAIEASGVKFVWRVEVLPPLEDLAPDKVLSVQRIVLEALTNALRHAAASSVTISAKYIAERDVIVIAIADDGVGFKPATAERGNGLRNMRSRAQRIGVRLDIDSSPGRGTRVTMELPAVPLGAAYQRHRPE